MALWTRSHPTVAEHIQNPLVADVAQAYTLAAVALLQGSNRFIIGPLTSKYVSHFVICLKFSSQHFRTMFQRHKLEKAEGKSYTDAGVSSIRSQSTAMLKQFSAGIRRDESHHQEIRSASRYQLIGQLVLFLCRCFPRVVDRQQGLLVKLWSYGSSWICDVRIWYSCSPMYRV